ncbi:MAG: ABC transporter permease [Casimicrobiaceae bacterium]
MKASAIARAGLRGLLYAMLMAAIALPFLTLAYLANTPAPGGGTATLSHYVATVLPGYVRTSLVLATLAVSLAIVIGAACAWQIERYQFPGRDVLAWALMLPLAMPAYVAAYVMADFTQFSGPLQSALRLAFGWSKGDYWFPEATSLPGAVVCFAFTLYPYVYLLARSAFAERGHELQDAARCLGMGRSRAWWSAVLPAARPAIAAGGVLALMEVLADYGAVSYLGVDTLSVGIFRAWYNMSDITSAAQLALALLTVVIVVVYAERLLRSRARYASTRARFVPRETVSGAPGIARTLLCMLPVLLGFALPALLLVRLHLQLDGATPWQEVLGWVGNSIQVGLWVAVVTLTLAVVLQTRQRLWRERAAAWMSRILGLGYAVPGAVLALGILIPLAAADNRLIDLIRSLSGASPGLLLTGSIVALVYAICVRFYGVAGNATASAYSRIPASLDDCARVLGLSRTAIFRRVHWPLTRRAVLAATLLVFIDTLKELPATLALRPFDFNTLATATYTFARDERLAEAALPSLLIVLASLPAVILLTRRTRDT